MSGRVTGIEPALGGRKAVDIFLDDCLWRRTNRRAAVSAGVCLGSTVDGTVAAALGQEERKVAEEMSLRLLGYRPRSTDEIRRKLTASGLGPEAVEAQIARLAQVGYLDDKEFARAWIDERLRVKHYGRRRIRSELMVRGVDPDLFESELDEVCSEEEELRRAALLLEGRFARRDQVSSDRREQQRAYVWLLRQGFEGETARRAVRSRFETGDAGAP